MEKNIYLFIYFLKAVSSCASAQDLYKCKNSNCVSKNFKCDTRNWCGDNSQTLIC